MPKIKSLQRKILPFLIIPFAIAALAQVPLFEFYELILYDLRLQHRPVQPVSDDIAIIEIDDEAIDRLGQWPLPRDFHASLIDVLHEAGAKTVIFDLVFSEEAPEDIFFVQSMKQAANVYLPVVFDMNRIKSIRRSHFEPAPLLIPVAESLRGSIEGKGHINIIIDPDGKVRRTLLYIQEEGRAPVAQLGLLAGCDYFGLDCAKAHFSPVEVTIDNKLKIPVSQENEVMINYPGAWEGTFKHYSYFEVLKAYQLWKEQAGGMGVLADLKDKVIFVGATAVGTIDLRATPLEKNYPMVGLHASLLNSLITGRYIHRLDAISNALISIALYALSILICINTTPLLSLFFSLLLAAVFSLGAIFSLTQAGLWIDMFYPLCVIAATYVGCVLIRWLMEIKERQGLEKEMQVASDIQHQFLVAYDQGAENVNVAQWFKPAKFVAGDLYDIFKIDEHKAGLFIGDVSGKGLPAALLMAQAISSFRIFSRQIFEPHEVLKRLNKTLIGQCSGRFITALYCIVDKSNRSIQVSSAGHGPFLIYRQREGRIECIEMPGKTPLGLLNHVIYENRQFAMQPGDKLVLYSDGVIEARDKEGAEFGQEALGKVILESAGNEPLQILEYLKSKLEQHAKDQLQHDDITIIVVSYKDIK